MKAITIPIAVIAAILLAPAVAAQTPDSLYPIVQAFNDFIQFLSEIPLMLTGFINAAMGQPIDCRTDPYNSNCFCPETHNKWSFDVTGVTKYACERKDLFLDPSEYDFSEQTDLYAKAVMEDIFPECDTVACEGTISYTYSGAAETADLWLRVAPGTDATGDRFALCECVGLVTGTSLSRIWYAIEVDLEDGHVVTLPRNMEFPNYPICRGVSDGRTWLVQVLPDGTLSAYET